MAIAAGTKAPDFTLKSKTASGLQDVSLSTNRGKKAAGSGLEFRILPKP